MLGTMRKESSDESNFLFLLTSMPKQFAKEKTFWQWNQCLHAVRAIIEHFSFQRPKTGHALCKECFFHCFESEIHNTITQNYLFNRGDVVAIAASGGKDSTVLGYVMKLLNERFDYGLNLVLLSIDEGIPGKRKFCFVT